MFSEVYICFCLWLIHISIMGVLIKVVMVKNYNCLSVCAHVYVYVCVRTWVYMFVRMCIIRMLLILFYFILFFFINSHHVKLVTLHCLANLWPSAFYFAKPVD